MRKYLKYLVVITLLLFPAMFGGSVHAAPAHVGKQVMPSAFFNLTSQNDWDGGTFGVHAQLAIDYPPLSNSADEEWQHNIAIYSPDYTRVALFGIEMCGGGTTSSSCNCQAAHFSGVHELFIEMTSNAGSTYTCIHVPSNDPNVGKVVDWAIEDNDTNNGVEFICSAPFSSAAFDQCNGDYRADTGGVSSYFSLPAWNHIHFYEHIRATFDKHMVFGSDMNLNRWRQGCIGAGCWPYFSTPLLPPVGQSCTQYNGFTNGCTNPVGNPPQVYWHVYPDHDTLGGHLFTCVYSTGTTCSLGS